jgi:hypothetical protein
MHRVLQRISAEDSMPSEKSRFIQRCVADVTAQGKELGAAFAICTAQSQKSGYSKPGSSTMTGKGAARERVFKGADDMQAKSAEYERAVQAGRQEAISMRALIRTIEEASMGGRMARSADAIYALASASNPGRNWRIVIEKLFRHVQDQLAAVDAMYADQPTYKSDDSRAEAERRKVVEDLDAALEALANFATNMRQGLRK